MKMTQLLTALALTLLCGAQAMALSPLGPPKAQLGQGKWGLGFDAGYQNMDLDVSGTYREYISGPGNLADCTLTIKDLKSQPVFGRISLGLNDNWDVFACLGAVNAKDDLVTQKGADSSLFYFYNNSDTYSLDGSHDFAWGVGTRFTLLEQEKISWGGVFRMTWQNPKASTNSSVNNTYSETLTQDLDLEYWEFVFAFGPTVNFGQISLYGGPMIHFVRGDLDVTGTFTGSDNGSVKADFDVEEESVIGGYAGAQWQMAENLCWYVDGQGTGNAWAVGVGALWRVQ